MPPVKGALPIVIRKDELDLLKCLFSDELKNHRLGTIIKDFQLIKVKSPEGFGDTPCIRIQHIASRSVEFDQVDDKDQKTHVDTWEKLIQLDIIVQHNQELRYNGIVFKDIEETLPLLGELVTRIISENLTYENENCPGVTIDDMEISNMMMMPEYDGDPDFASVTFMITVKSEKER